MSKGAFTLRTWPDHAVVIRCDECGREGRYARATLAARFGPARAMPDVLDDTTKDCTRGGSGFMARCRQAVFVDPHTGQPWSVRWIWG